MAIEYNLNSEDDLIKQIAQKNQKALSTFYDKYAKLIYSLIFKIVQKHDDTEEVLQEVIMQIWDKAQYFNAEKGNVYVWVVTLTRNKAIDKIRSKFYKQNKVNSDLETVSLFYESKEESGLDHSISNERSKKVKAALGKIPENQKILLEDAYYLGFSQSELADRYELPLGTVKTRMRSGLKKLASLIDGEEI